MEKTPRSKGTIMLRYLQKAATFTITNNPHSPRSGERLPTIRGFSCPIGSIFIPTEARYKMRNDDTFNEEPTSPKVTCIGQIKHKNTTAAKERSKKMKKQIPYGLTRILSQKVKPDHREMEMREKKKEEEEKKRHELAIETTIGAASAPTLGQLKKFASRREALADFDWEKAATTVSEDDFDYVEGKDELTNI